MSLVVTTDFQLNRVAAPNLPRAPIQYNPQYQEQLNNVSRLYFNRIDSILSQLTGKKFTELRIPYGAFSSVWMRRITKEQSNHKNRQTTHQKALADSRGERSHLNNGASNQSVGRSAIHN